MPTTTTRFVTSSTAGYLRWLAHLHRNLQLLGLARQFSVCAHDHATTKFASARGLHVVRWYLDGSGGSGGTTDGASAYSHSWTRINHAKHHCLYSLLEVAPKRTSLLFIDADMTLFRNPLRALPSARAADVAFLDDRGGWSRMFTGPQNVRSLNGGFFLLRVCKAARAFYRLFVRALQRNGRMSDQFVLNNFVDDLVNISATSGGRLDVRVLHQQSGSLARTADPRAYVDGSADLPALRYDLEHMAAEAAPGGAEMRATTRAPTLPRLSIGMAVLDQLLYQNGFRFYENRGRLPLDASAIVAVHHNWIGGDENKHRRAIEFDTILEQDNETLGQFEARALWSMARRPPWKYKKPAPPPRLRGRHHVAGGRSSRPQPEPTHTPIVIRGGRAASEARA